MRPGGPKWQRNRRLWAQEIPAKILDWIFDPASLTARLRAVCPGRFHVAVLAQRWLRPAHGEARALGMRPGRYGLVRQVYLCCGDRTLVFARTVIPPGTLSGKERKLASLKTRPLGALLFAEPSLRRVQVSVERLVPGDALYATASRAIQNKPKVIWGRRSLFTIKRKALMVSEYFLPDIPPCKP